MLQYAATQLSTRTRAGATLRRVGSVANNGGFDVSNMATDCNALQYIATHYNIQQYTAAYLSTRARAGPRTAQYELQLGVGVLAPQALLGNVAVVCLAAPL